MTFTCDFCGKPLRDGLLTYVRVLTDQEKGTSSGYRFDSKECLDAHVERWADEVEIEMDDDYS